MRSSLGRRVIAGGGASRGGGAEGVPEGVDSSAGCRIMVGSTGVLRFGPPGNL